MTPNAPKSWTSLAALVLATVGAVLYVEGGFVDDPNDSGGATNHGVTEVVAREHGYTGSMQELPQDTATAIYIDTYVKKPGFDRVLAHSPAVGAKVIDIGVNAGPGRAARWLQQSVNDLSRAGRDYPRIAVDGRVGPGTLAAYRALEQRRGRQKACELMLKALDGYQTAHYLNLAQGDANASFIVGWLDHRIGNVPASRCEERVQP